MAFNKLGQYGIEAGDMRSWAGSNSTKAFVAEINEQKKLAFNQLLKCGEKGHNEHAECYKAFDKVLRLIESASKLK